jgi:hypothetical protein
MTLFTLKSLLKSNPLLTEADSPQALESLCHQLADQLNLWSRKQEIAVEIIRSTKLCELMPDIYERYRQIVYDGVLFLLTNLSNKRFIHLLKTPQNSFEFNSCYKSKHLFK